MTRNLDKHDKNMKKFPIRPMKIPGKIKKIPISKIMPGTIPEKSIEISEAVVAYLDVLGFSEKKDDEDIEFTLFDFSGPIALSATHYPEVRFNVFSDCAFIAASVEHGADLLSAIRFAFTQWVADGILVRGGIARGTYKEIYTVALKMTSKNFIGSLFSGSAVTAAVKLEGSGPGALLFTNEECAEFYNRQYGELIFSLKDYKIIGWSDEDSSLYWFTGISFLRLLRLLSLKDGTKYPVTEKLLNNIRYSFAATDSSLPRFLVLAILSSPIITPEVRAKSLDLLKIKDPDDFVPFKEVIDEWLSDTENLKVLKFLADEDSSIP